MQVGIQVPPALLDSATAVSADHCGRVVVTASHAGVYAAYLVAQHGVRAAIFNDAGVGLDNAGIAGLAYLDSIDIPAAAVGHDSARIGDAADSMARGTITHSNQSAKVLGVSPGQSCADAAEILSTAAMRDRPVPSTRETRILLELGEVPVIGLDSAALVQPTDAGAIIITGSHGGLVGGNPGKALQVDAAGALFHDAGVGIEQAGIRRLAVLDCRGIAAAAVDGRSARIGDARSIWQTGRLAHVNETARQAGAAVGMTAQDFAAVVRAAMIDSAGRVP